MKQLYLFILVCSMVLSSLAQSTTTSTTINKKSQPALMLTLPYNTDLAEGTILKKLKETGYSPETTGSLFWKKNKVDGFYVFNGIVLPALNNQKLDMYFKVERLGKKNQNLSTVYLLLSKGGEEFISAQSDAVTFNAATTFLNSFVEETASYRLDLDIEAQDKVLKNAEKKLVNLQQDEENMHKKIAQLQADIVKKKEEQEKQTKVIAEEKLKLEALKAKTIKDN